MRNAATVATDWRRGVNGLANKAECDNGAQRRIIIAMLIDKIPVRSPGAAALAQSRPGA